MRARLLALTSGLVVLIGFPLGRWVARAVHPAPGDLDLSDAWAWTPVVLAGLATSAAVLLWCRHRESLVATSRPGVHESFAYHDAMLQRMVVARMALDLDEPDRAGQVLDTVIESASGVITSLVGGQAGTLPGRVVEEVV